MGDQKSSSKQQPEVEMKIHNVEQNSPDWLILRSGKVTASEAKSLVSPTFEVRKGDMPKTYLSLKLAERWIGGNIPTEETAFDMEQGKILEEEAKPFYTMTTGNEISNVGFITSDDEKSGCSPDGWGKSFAVEIKCPKLQTHIGYLLSGELPEIYRVQCQFSMFVTGLSEWQFMSYRRSFPPLILNVKRDQKAQDAIKAALDSFYVAMDAGYSKLCDLNGGPPNRKQIKAVQHAIKKETSFDLIP
jgi:hypothetical protein